MFHSIADLYTSHPVFFGALAMALANAAVTAMPSPRPNGSQFYAWAFNFLHSAVGAISRIVAQYKNGNGNASEAP
ncbi:MAG TPA: hypothetical protein VKB26_05605 [Candidatus Acidoferrales bacterium]|nr:hypothetical protein [Candidatus Acidoferrales bacterium]